MQPRCFFVISCGDSNEVQVILNIFREQVKIVCVQYCFKIMEFIGFIL